MLRPMVSVVAGGCLLDVVKGGFVFALGVVFFIEEWILCQAFFDVTVPFEGFSDRAIAINTDRISPG